MIDSIGSFCYNNRQYFFGGETLVDIHSHVAPALDDGADSLEESLEMLEAAFESGTKHMVVTPHYLNESQCRFDVQKSDIERAFALLCEAKDKAGIPIELYLGAEHFGVTDISRYAGENRLIPINGSRYLLVEFDFADDVRRVLFVTAALGSAGFVPVVAHPERYEFLQSNPSLAFSLLEKGCLLQVNKGSPLGKYGFRPQTLSKWLLDNHLVHCVASDCHSPYRRTPEMRSAHEMLTYRLGAEYTEKIFNENPMKILKNETVDFI